MDTKALSEVLKQQPRIFEYEGLWGMPSRCAYRRYPIAGNKTVLVVSELYKDNPGTPIAEVSASLAGQFCRVLGIDPASLIYVEHNPCTHSKLSFYEEEFFLVRFSIAQAMPDKAPFAHPDYNPISPSDLLALIEQALRTA